MKPRKIEYRQINRSSTIDGIAYDQKQGILSVRFITGDEYQYAGVPPQLAQAFEHSKSMGQFIHKQLKGYKFRKL